ncbi:MAG: hypothetical protein SFY68_14585, partial [Candidatus Sumerlaeia bacterium]|nr:hypothetical protein [Candidatus Sumerlaeia bacterium]
MKRFVYSLTTLMSLSLLAFPSLTQGGHIVHAPQLDLGEDPLDNSDDILKYAPIAWGENDYTNSGLSIYIYRNRFETSGQQILPLNSFGNNFDFFENTDLKILDAASRAVQQWNAIEGSQFKFRSPIFSDFAPTFDPINLPFGPEDARFDRFNLITFSDPSFNGSQTAVVYFPTYVYANQDFLLSQLPVNNPVNGQFPQFLNFEELDIFFIGGGEADEVQLRSRVADLSVTLPRIDYPAGTILDSDIIFTTNPDNSGGGPNFGNGYWILPQTPSELSTINPPLSANEVLGLYDIEALITSAIGRMAGLDQSQLYESTLAPAYIAIGDDPDGLVTETDTFATNPFEFRSLSIDDELTMRQAYGSGSFSTGIYGNLLNGAFFDGVVGEDEGEFDPDNIQVAGIPLQTIYLARPLGNETVTLDTLALDFTIREELSGFEDIEVGRMKLVGSTFTGFPIFSARGPNSPQFQLTGDQGVTGSFGFPGIPRRSDWYLVAANPSVLPNSFNDAGSLVDLFSVNDNGIGLVPAVNVDFEADFEPEFFGGVRDPFLRYGRGNLGTGVTDLQDQDASSIRSSFLELFLSFSINSVITIDDNGAIVAENLEPNGDFYARIASGPIFLQFPNGQTAVVRLVRQSDGKIFDFPNTGLGFGGSPGTITLEDDDLNVYEIQFTLPDKLGQPIGVLTQRIEFTNFPTFEPIPVEQENFERGIKVTYTFQNISGEDYSFGLAQIVDPVFGLSSGALSNVPLFVNGVQETRSTGYGRSNERPIPASVDWYDNEYLPYFQFSLISNDADTGLTIPDRLLTVNTDRARRAGNPWTITPGESLSNLIFGSGSGNGGDGGDGGNTGGGGDTGGGDTGGGDGDATNINGP